MSVEKYWNEICGRGKREKPREKPTQTSFRPPRNPHGGTETRTRDPSGGRRAPNRLRHEAAFRTYESQNLCRPIIIIFYWLVKTIYNTYIYKKQYSSTPLNEISRT